MAKRTLMEQLDEAVQELLVDSGGRGAVNPELQLLLEAATGLRGMPRASFKARLKAELEERAKTLASKTQSEAATARFAREGFHSITPYIAVREAQQVIDFVKQAFGAEGTTLGIGSAGGMHAEYRIGDSMVMIGGGVEAKMTPMPASLHVYVRDVDATYERAMQAGAVSLLAPMDQPYGDRDASVQDAGGNYWYIGTHKASGVGRPGLRTVTPYLHVKEARETIGFLKSAFAAEEVAIHASQTGVIQHAVMRIGDSMIEMGEAHGQFQPMPSMFYLYVESADEWYWRALEAGANSLSAPEDQPYGDRVALVTDGWGNQWFLATHLANKS